MFIYRKATIKDLERYWDNKIQKNPEDDRLIKWKEEDIQQNLKEDKTTFMVLNNDEPIGQISLIFNPTILFVKCRDLLCNKLNIANFAAFSIKKQFEGMGHISKLVKLAENYAKEKGIDYLTIGSKAKESRNLSIYFHFGFTEFITSVEQDGYLILFYGKKI